MGWSVDGVKQLLFWLSFFTKLHLEITKITIKNKKQKQTNVIYEN